MKNFRQAMTFSIQMYYKHTDKSCIMKYLHMITITNMMVRNCEVRSTVHLEYVTWVTGICISGTYVQK